MRLFALLAIAGLALAACAELPAEVTVVGCELGPVLVPDHAAEIAQACALQAAAQAGVVIPQ